MVNIDVLSQLIDSMDEAVAKLEKAQTSGDVNYVNRLRIFIYDIQRQIDASLNGKR